MRSSSESATGGTFEQRTVDQFEQYTVVAGDDDVLDAVVVDERLEATKPKEGVEHRVSQAGLVSRVTSTRSPHSPGRPWPCR